MGPTFPGNFRLNQKISGQPSWNSVTKRGESSGCNDRATNQVQNPGLFAYTGTLVSSHKRQDTVVKGSENPPAPLCLTTPRLIDPRSGFHTRQVCTIIEVLCSRSTGSPVPALVLLSHTAAPWRAPCFATFQQSFPSLELSFEENRLCRAMAMSPAR